ncbi:MAG: RNA polymerase sigma factor [Myxococcales bacterium]|jgi:RNA polymerase sigma factor (sigma-70 family)
MTSIDSVLVHWFAALAPGAVQPDDQAEVLRLVARAQNGDRSAGEALYRMHVHRVFRAVRPLCRSEQETEDVVQESFVRALAGIGGFRPRPGRRFVSWLMTIAANVARRRSRWFRRAVYSCEEPDPSDDPPPDELLDNRRRRAALLEALATLAPRDREIVSLRYGSELSCAEVAEATGLSEVNVRKICERQRRKLLDLLEAKLGAPEAAGRSA